MKVLNCQREREIQNTKLIMNKLMECIKDKNISISDRKQYYTEYLQISKNYLMLTK